MDFQGYDLQGYDLRYLITSLVGRGATTTTELRRALERLGVDLGSDPRRRLYGALRSEMRKGRLRRVERAGYALDRIPRSTHHRIEVRARLVEACMIAGTMPPTDRARSGDRQHSPTWLDQLPTEDDWAVVSRLRDASSKPPSRVATT